MFGTEGTEATGHEAARGSTEGERRGRAREGASLVALNKGDDYMIEYPQYALKTRKVPASNLAASPAIQ